MGELVLEHSRVLPVGVERAFDTLLPVPLDRIFGRRFLLIPAVVGTDQDGVWGKVGQTRTVRQSGGGRMREELVSLERPHAFGYTLTVLRGPLKLLAGPIAGEWRFEPAGQGTRIVWSWRVPPASAPAALTLPALRPLWEGFARQGFDAVEGLLG